MLALAAFLPTVLLGGAAAWSLAGALRDASETSLAKTSEALALAVDREFSRVITALAVVAAATDADAASLDRLAARAQRVAAQLQSPLVVTDLAGRRLLSTKAEDARFRGQFVSARSLVETVAATGQPAVGDLVLGSVSGRYIFAIGVAMRDASGAPAHVLGTAYDPAWLRSLLAAQQLPPGAVATIRDAADVVVARSDEPPGIADGNVLLEDAGPRPSGRHRGIEHAVDRAGIAYIVASQPIAAAPGWTVAVAQDAAALAEGWRRPLLSFGYVALAGLLLAGVVSLAVARAILVPVARLGELAGDASADPDSPAGMAVPPAPHHIREFNQLTVRVIEARQDRAARQGALQAAEALQLQVEGQQRELKRAAAELLAETGRREALQLDLLRSEKLAALGLLTSSVAHDFNNVLAAISASLHLIGKTVTEPAVPGLIAEGNAAVERAAMLVRQLLGFARREPMRPAVVELGEVLPGIAEMLALTLGRQLDVSSAVAPGLWPVLLDRQQFEVALLNLASNARDAMPRGGRLHIAAARLVVGPGRPDLRPGDYVAIEVSDTGEGMPPEVAAHAAEPFFTTKPAGKGTGLGLPMVRRFAEASGGTLQIESAAGKGTLVRIILPRAQVIGVAAEGAPPPARQGVATAPSQGGLPAPHGQASILLVEPVPHVRAAIASILRDLGYSVSGAANAEAAEAIAMGLEALDLVLTDADLPGTDGAALAARLRAERPDLPCLFMSDRPAGPALSGEIMLGKPLHAAELTAALLEALGRTGHRRRRSPAARLTGRLSTPAIWLAYLAWHAARRAGEDLPRLAALDIPALGISEDHALVGVEFGRDGEPDFTFLRVGATLRQRLGRSLEATTLPKGADDLAGMGSIGGAYRRCARLAIPVFEAARYDLGDGCPVRFERLSLPLSEDGASVSHLLVLAVFDGPTGRVAPEANDPALRQGRL